MLYKIVLFDFLCIKLKFGLFYDLFYYLIIYLFILFIFIKV